MCVRAEIFPTALTIDVEGAELLVLWGAEKTLAENSLKVWVSIHEDLMERDFGRTTHEVHTFMEGLGYSGEHLATDHEEHYFYTKEAK